MSVPISVRLRLPLPAPPWRDRRGAFSPLKTATLALLATPAAALLLAFVAGELGAEPVERLQDELGRWALRFLLLSLLVTPLRLLWRWGRLIEVRRLVGLAALFYALAHLASYVALEDWVLAKVAGEIVSRVYLTIGAAALTGLVVLGVTSTDNAVRRLGAGRWQALHRLAYPIALLAVVHFFLQTRLDPTEAFVMGGLLAWLLALRAVRWANAQLTPASALGLAVAVTLATAGAEALWFHLRFGAPVEQLLLANLQTAAGARPAWWVAGATLPVGLVAVLRARFKPQRAPRRVTA